MEQLSWIGFGAFFGASLVVGIRLVLLARRTGHLPELMIGIGVLGIGPLGFGLRTLASVPGRSTIVGATLIGCSFLALFVGASSQYLFAWYVFRLRDRWAKPLCFGAILLLAAGYAGDLLENGLFNRSHGGAWFWLGLLLRLAVLGWNAGESFAYWTRMRRRLRLGLADPVVTNRFFLWGVGSGAAFLGTSIGAVAFAVSGWVSSGHPELALLVSLHGGVAAVAMWLAFVPPGRYRRWIQARGRRLGGDVPSERA